MKSREIFEAVRNRKKDSMSLQLRVTLLVTAELIVSVLVALGLYWLFNKLVAVESFPFLALVLLLTCLIMGFVVTYFLSRWIYTPMKKLTGAMEQVADGDFSVRLEDKVSSKETLELYTGFNLMVNELGSTETLQSDFISNVSHEFKTPLSAIEGYATLLLGSEHMSAEEQIYAEKIVDNTRRLSSLVGSILLLSKMENQQIPSNRQEYRLDEQIRQSIVALEPSWEPKEVEFDVDLERTEYVGNEAMMRHVWDNLLSNAVKFSPACGLVRVTLRREGARLVAAVEDSGPGIPPEAQKHIYDKFYQADGSHRAEGNGLGLTLVKRILTLEGGSVAAENIPGGGCRFTVRLRG